MNKNKGVSQSDRAAQSNPAVSSKASIPDASERGAHSNQYTKRFYGIINADGALWTPRVFASTVEAQQYRDDQKAVFGKSFKRLDVTHRIVPVEFRIEPLAESDAS